MSLVHVDRVDVFCRAIRHAYYSPCISHADTDAAVFVVTAGAGASVSVREVEE